MIDSSSSLGGKKRITSSTSVQRIAIEHVTYQEKMKMTVASNRMKELGHTFFKCCMAEESIVYFVMFSLPNFYIFLLFLLVPL